MNVLEMRNYEEGPGDGHEIFKNGDNIIGSLKGPYQTRASFVPRKGAHERSHCTENGSQSR